LRHYLVLPLGKSFGLWLGSSSQNCKQYPAIAESLVFNFEFSL
jgi:hypothetical protein